MHIHQISIAEMLPLEGKTRIDFKKKNIKRRAGFWEDRLKKRKRKRKEQKDLESQ